MKQIEEGKTKEVLQENEIRLFRSLVDHILDGVFVVDSQLGRLLDIN